MSVVSPCWVSFPKQCLGWIIYSHSSCKVLMGFKIQRSLKKVRELDSSGLFVKTTVNSKDLFQFSHPEVMIMALFLYLAYCWASAEISAFEKRFSGAVPCSDSRDLMTWVILPLEVRQPLCLCAHTPFRAGCRSPFVISRLPLCKQ